MSVTTTRGAARLRTALFTSVALATMTIAGAAHAQASADYRPSLATTTESPQSGILSIGNTVDSPQASKVSTANEMPMTSAIASANVVDSPSITINNNFTPSQIFDPTNITGVGQLVTDGGGGSVGLCTATKINARVVLFAAHCVNGTFATATPATNYGANSGGTGIAIAFETNTRANGAGQTDELLNWLFGIGTGPGQFKTNTAQALYNISQVFYNPASRSTASCSASANGCFIEGDIAVGITDTPTLDTVPTWAMLFSPLPTPGAIGTATGTGYHVVIEGYGRNGTGTTGAAGSDFRRRVAENMLGALTSISERNAFLFGSPGSPARPQLLYWLDFDDPARGTATASPFDFNGFRDNALPREGLTGPGDSGGPLILDKAYAKAVILGTLSGGSTFFAGQPGGSYGTQSFYQPLFLYWDWIVANNPYRYVTANAGNKNWEDATAWVTTLDPAYNIITGVTAANPLGTLTNGVPTNNGGTNQVTTPKFGEFCDQEPGFNECVNIATGVPRNNVPNGGIDTSPVLGAAIAENATPDAMNLAGGEVATSAGVQRFGGVQSSLIEGAFESPSADPGFSNTVTAAPTLANGLPGATNFVPNNVDGVRTTGVAGRYYDVTLRNAGIVSLNSTVTVDRFTMMGAQSQLSVTSGSSITSLLAFNHLTGIVLANGTVNAPGEYLFGSGLLMGTGRVNAPFLTNVLGNIAPGTVGTVGTLTLSGNLVLSTGSTFVVDLAGAGSSDRLAVIASATTPSSTGVATLGGNVLFAPTTAVRNGDVYTILTAAGGFGGTKFASGNALSAILTPTFTYTANAVQVQVVAGTYLSVVAPTSPVQVAFANLLDQNRAANSSLLASLYGPLDLQSAATIQTTLDSLAPRTETMINELGVAATDGLERFYAGRISQLGSGRMDGTVALIGQPMSVISANNLAGSERPDVAMGSAETTVAPANLPEGMNAYLAGGYTRGKLAPMPGAVGGTKSKYDGYYLAAGIEKDFGNGGGAGISASYTQLDSDPVVNQEAKGRLYQASIYGRTATKGIAFDGQLSGGWFDISTRRVVTIVGTSYTLLTKSRPFAGSAEVGVGYLVESDSFKLGPRASLRGSTISFKDVSETGGGPALTYDRKRLTSVQGRAGMTASGGKKVQLDLSAYYVHDFNNAAATVGANFVGGTGPNAVFAIANRDKNWAEGSISLGVNLGSVRLSAGADATLGRDDVSNETYRGSISFRF